MLERLFQKFGGDETTGMSNISHKKSTNRISDFSELGVIVISWIGTGTADYHLGLELSGLFGQCLIVDKAIFFLNIVWLTLKVNR